ncbi:MAG: xanthine dehydrogenase family protein molybdopterin-binding subunit [Acidimicrobiia bacterium]|nr:xanthine dehydrogenase family protein molybdopterin-binding subunit [Acidimicrobiia bacterium]MDH5504076.1 xanthine dehydrogenase family protein molybdopterin-binding subunit [Acidimicrobiia bacterium]
MTGMSEERVDAHAKVTGKALYALDLTVSGMLHGHLVRSTRAHATIRSIDVAAALATEGVVAAITADDLGDLFARYGHIVADHPILAIDKVRYYGEPVVLVVADNPYAAADGASHVRVRYADLPVMINPEDALAEGAERIHSEDYEYGDRSFEEAQSTLGDSNLAHVADLEWGDVDGAFASAPHVVESNVTYPMLYAYAMEPYNAVAWFDEGELEVVSTAQHPFQVRSDLARIFSLPLNQVRVRSPLLGGGYGSKSYTKVEPLAAVAAWITGRPVKVATDVDGAIHTTRADGATIRVRSAFADDGAILARDFDITFNTGAYADNGPLVLAKAVNRCYGPYLIPNVRVRGRAVFTNTVPTSSYRGFGAPQGNLAGELNLDQAAEKIGIDPAEIRRRNLVPPGGRHLPGKRGMDADLVGDLELVLDALGWKQDQKLPLRGTGFGCSASDAGAFPVSTATVRLFPDGSVTVLTGSTEMGQGSRTALAQIAARELGIKLDRVRVVQSDTAATPYERTTGASRTTTLTGLAVQRACRDALRKLEEIGAEKMDCTIEEVKTADGVVAGPQGELGYDEAIQWWFGGVQGEITGVGVVRRAGDLKELPPFWEIGMVGVTVTVDRDTGRPTVEHLVTVGDVGHAINPAMVEGQDLGAATQGLGAALFEELIYDGPQLVNPNLVDYRVPRTTDVPKRIDTIIVENADGVGPYGAKGSGEGSLNPIGGAVASAVARAIGVWPNELPLTPERVWRLMQTRQVSDIDS